MNNGIGDAHNLAWKIHEVLSHQAPDCLLNTYETERRPVAIANATQSTENQKALMRLLFASQSIDPTNPQQIEEDIELRDRIQKAIDDNVEHFDSIGLQIGYVYGKPVQGPCNIYAPSSVPGARLPHAWVTGIGRFSSTLDLIDGQSFVLITTNSFLIDAGESILLEKEKISVSILRLGVDFVVDDMAWIELLGLNKPSSGVLIRPDQHILAHVTSVEAVRAAVKEYLVSGALQ